MGLIITQNLSIYISSIFQNSLNFTYTLIKPSDGQWGVLKNGRWTGMIGALHQREVDIGKKLS